MVSDADDTRSGASRKKRSAIAAQLEFIAGCYAVFILVALLAGPLIFSGPGGPIVDAFPPHADAAERIGSSQSVTVAKGP